MENINLIIIIAAIALLLVLLMIRKRRDEDDKCKDISCNYKKNCLSYCNNIKPCPKLDCSECPVCPQILQSSYNMRSSTRKIAPPSAGVGRWVLDSTTCKCNTICGEGKTTCRAKCSTGNPKDCAGSPPTFYQGTCNNGPCRWYFNQDPVCPNPNTYLGPLTLKNIAQCPVPGQCKDPKPADRVINCPTGTGYADWILGSLGECKIEPGQCIGKRTRTVHCPYPGRCKGEKPQESFPCTNSACPWTYSQWGPWQKVSGEDKCGIFISNRSVTGCSAGDASWCKNSPQDTRKSIANQEDCHWKVTGMGKCDDKGLAPLFYSCPIGRDEPCIAKDGPRPKGYYNCKK